VPGAWTVYLSSLARIQVPATDIAAMADPSLYTYPSPLQGYEGSEPLPSDTAADGKSFVNPPAAAKSEAYHAFTAPITNGTRGGFDIHIYFLQTDADEVKYATELWERIRREFPELRIYKIWDRPLGPHPIGMFEVNVFTPGKREKHKVRRRRIAEST
jgi:hypothetical protein